MLELHKINFSAGEAVFTAETESAVCKVAISKKALRNRSGVWGYLYRILLTEGIFGVM